MSAVVKLPSADVTVDDINAEHRLARESAENAVQHAIRCGELLLVKKAELNHGEFMRWIADHCEFEQSTASRYIKAAQQNSIGVEISALRGLWGPSPKEAKRSAALQHSYDIGRDGRHECHDDDEHDVHEDVGGGGRHPQDDTDERYHEEDEHVAHGGDQTPALDIEAAIRRVMPFAVWTSRIWQYRIAKGQVTKLRNRLARAERTLADAEAAILEAARAVRP